MAVSVAVLAGLVIGAGLIGSAVQNGLEKIAEAIRIYSYQNSKKV